MSNVNRRQSRYGCVNSAPESHRLSSKVQFRSAWLRASKWIATCFMAVGVVLSNQAASAQDRFLLEVPGEARPSSAELDANELRITDHQGAVTRYRREPKWDSLDGPWIGFESATAAQIIRWPAKATGPMLIGTKVAGAIEFRASRMQVRRLGGVQPVLPPAMPPGGLPGIGGLPPGAAGNAAWQVNLNPGSVQTIQWSTRDDRLQSWYLGRSVGVQATILPQPVAGATEWMVVPTGSGFAGSGMVRMQQVTGGRWAGLSVDRLRTLRMEPLSQSVDQLWRLTPSHFAAQSYLIESVSNPGWVLSALPGGNLVLAPISGAPMQVWSATIIAPPANYEPLWRTVSHEVRPNPPLPPAVVDLQNSSRQSLTVLIADRRNNAVQKVRIEPGSFTKATLDRDAGATIVEVFELRSPSGVWDRKEFATPVPPNVIYDLSVYEDIIQSIAIDRTGTSPNVIEDINVQPKSLGWIALLPGSQMPDRGEVDVYAQAKAADNPGAVRRLDPRSLEKPAASPDPLQKILDDIKQPPAPVSRDL